MAAQEEACGKLPSVLCVLSSSAREAHGLGPTDAPDVDDSHLKMQIVVAGYVGCAPYSTCRRSHASVRRRCMLVFSVFLGKQTSGHEFLKALKCADRSIVIPEASRSFAVGLRPYYVLYFGMDKPYQITGPTLCLKVVYFIGDPRARLH